MDAGERRAGLPPVSGEEPKVLILGTIPSVLSSRKKEYYGNPRNHFWRLMEEVLGVPKDLPYPVRCRLLMEKGVALWDVLAECRVRGSQDSSISDPEPNDISSFLRERGSVRCVFLNGRQAQRQFERLVAGTLPGTGTPSVALLPSSSPANAIRMEEKVKAWMVLRKPLG